MTETFQDILRSVTYHDLFDFPMTAAEIALDAGLPLAAVMTALGEAKALESRRGFWFLSGRDAIVETRLRRYDVAESKYAGLRRFLRLARYAPFLRAAFVCNTLGRSNAKEESDIDLFVAAAPGRIWTVRLFATGLAALLGVRPTAEETRDRLCLSFYVTEDALNLRPQAIEGDVYLPRWLADVYPMYDEAGIAALLLERNRWAFGPRRFAAVGSHRRALAPAGAGKRLAEALLAPFAGLLERFAKTLQMRWFPERIRSGARGPIVISDAMLKFHDKDRRAEIRDKYLEALARLEKSEIRNPKSETRFVLRNGVSA